MSVFGLKHIPIGQDPQVGGALLGSVRLVAWGVSSSALVVQGGEFAINILMRAVEVVTVGHVIVKRWTQILALEHLGVLEEVSDFCWLVGEL